MPHENTMQGKKYIFTWKYLVMLKILSFKNSISLTLFHPVYFIEIVIIVGRQSLPLFQFRKLQIEKLNIKYVV